MMNGGHMEQADLIRICMKTLPKKLTYSAKTIWFKKMKLLFVKVKTRLCFVVCVIFKKTQFGYNILAAGMNPIWKQMYKKIFIFNYDIMILKIKWEE